VSRLLAMSRAAPHLSGTFAALLFPIWNTFAARWHVLAPWSRRVFWTAGARAEIVLPLPLKWCGAAGVAPSGAQARRWPLASPRARAEIVFLEWCGAAGAAASCA